MIETATMHSIMPTDSIKARYDIENKGSFCERMGADPKEETILAKPVITNIQKQMRK